MHPSDPQDVPLARPASLPLPSAESFTGPLPYARPLNPLLLSEHSPRHALLDAGLVLLTAVVVHYVPQLLAAILGQEHELPKVDWSVAAGKWLEAALALALAAYFVLRHGTPPAVFGFRADRPLVQFAWGVLAWIAVYIYMFATALLFAAAIFASSDGQQEIERRMDFIKKLPLDNVSLTSVLLVAVAIHEELLFRGLLLPLFRRATGRWWSAVVITSAIFGALHFPQGWVAMIQITGVSIVLSVFFVVSRSLLAVILAHFLFDFAQMQLMRVIPRLLDWLRQQEGAPAAFFTAG
jgi:membrane protease YdiL (CAAX protease family)